MIERIPAQQHYRFRNAWLEADWHFSFQRYFDPNRVHFGSLRAYNHDHIAPGRGFAMHPHREMEIISWVRRGTLVHEDDRGLKVVAGAGDFLALTAGSGVEHAELNGGDGPVELIQIWVLPEEEHLVPSLEKTHVDLTHPTGGWDLVVTGEGLGGRLIARQDLRVAVARVEPGETLEFASRSRHPLYIQCLDGAGQLNGVSLEERDVAQLRSEPTVTLRASRAGEWILIEVPEL